MRTFDHEKRQVSISFDNAPFPLAMSALMTETGAAIVWGRDCDDTVVSGVFVEQDLYSLLLALAKRYGMQLSEIEGVFFLGVGTSSDLVSTVVRAPTSSTTLTQDLRGILSEYGKISQVGSSLIISDYLYNVKKAHQVISSLRADELRAYVVEVFFIRMYDSDLVDMQVRLAAENVDLFSCSWNLDQLFRATLDFSGSRSRARIVKHPILYLTEGTQTTFEVGTDIVREQASVSAEGYSTISGYKTFSDGVRLVLRPTRVSSDVVSLDVDLSVSDFDENSGTSGIPATSKSSITAPGVLVSDGGVYFLGSLQLQNLSRTFGIVSMKGENSDEILTVWVKLREIGVEAIDKL